MATHDYVIDNGTGSAVRTDLNNAFAAIVSNNSSSSEPSTTYAYQLWADTNNNILKIRNSANNAWINLFTLAGGVDVDAASNFNEDVTFTGASANIVFDKSDNALEFADNAKAIFGTGGDLEIFHDASDSILNDAGTGSIKLQLGGSTKAEVVSGGVTVTGTCTATAFAGDGSALTGVGGGVSSDAQSNTVGGTGAGGNFSGTDAEENTLFGKNAGEEITTGDNNCAFGREALHLCQTHSNNTAIGHNALNANVASNNTAVGKDALVANTSGIQNTALGRGSLGANTTASNNSSIGYQSLAANTTGTFNNALGNYALGANTTGGYNTAVGSNALDANTTASENTAVGSGALGANTTGEKNTAVGSNALQANTTGSSNVAVGYQAGDTVTTGVKNVLIGYSAGNNITTGSDVVAIGQNCKPHAVDGYNQVIMGNTLTGAGNNTSKFVGNVYNSENQSSFQTTSDIRIKKNIVENKTGLDAINQIVVKNFEYKTEDEIIKDSPELTKYSASAVVKNKGLQLGVIAQEIEKVLPDVVKTFEDSGIKTVNSDNITWYLVNAIKELSAKVTALEEG